MSGVWEAVYWLGFVVDAIGLAVTGYGVWET